MKYTDQIAEFIKSLYPNEHPVPLHAPRFLGKEKEYLLNCIDSTYVSYVGEYVKRFEDSCAEYVGVKYAIAMVNGTSALHIALKTIGVQVGDAVLTQALSFVATANAIAHCGATPIFIDVDENTLGMDPDVLSGFLDRRCEMGKNDTCYDKMTHRRISACVPVHVFGHPLEIDEISACCRQYKIPIVEDAAESLGSFYNKKHTGTTGIAGILSFNGNKIITTGGGGMIITDNETIAQKAKHLSTTAKKQHAWEFVHDAVGYNYRMPNVNAAIGCAQLEQLPTFLKNKRELSQIYRDFFETIGVKFYEPRTSYGSNHWLNSIVLKGTDERNEFLQNMNGKGIQSRPLWRPLSKLPMYEACVASDLTKTYELSNRIVNIPSSVRR